MLKKRIGQWKEKLLNTNIRDLQVNYKERKSKTFDFANINITDFFKKVKENERFQITIKQLNKKEVEEIEEVEIDENDDAEEIENTVIYEYGDISSTRTPKDAVKTLNILRTKAREELEERGISALYIAFGFLEWGFPNSENTFLAPLIMVPIKLEKESNIRYQFSIQSNYEIMLNPVLVKYLSNEFSIQIDSDFDINMIDDIKEMLNLIATNKDVKAYGWKVLDDVKMTIFSSISLYLYNDIDQNEVGLINHDAIRMIFSSNSGVEYAKDIVKEENLDLGEPSSRFQVIDADSSQLRAIVSAKKGANFVLQGPPGTGKSQTITNIIAELLAEGKSVLFVAEKMAALDVVHSQLERANLSDFCLSVHGGDSKTNDMVNDLEKTLNLKNNNGTINLEILDKLKQEEIDLNEYKNIIHQIIKPLDKSIFQVQSHLIKYSHLPVVSNFKIDNIDIITENEILENVSYIKHYAEKIEKIGGSEKSHYLYGFKDKAVISSFDFNEVFTKNIEDLIAKLKFLQMLFDELRMDYGIDDYKTIYDVNSLINLVNHLSNMPVVKPKWFKDKAVTNIIRKLNDYLSEKKSIQKDTYGDFWAKWLEEEKYNKVDFDEHLKTLNWINDLFLMYKNYETDKLVESMFKVTHYNGQISHYMKELRNASRDIEKYLKNVAKHYDIEIYDFNNIDIKLIIEKLELTKKGLHSVGDWVSYIEEKEKCQNNNLGAFILEVSDLEIDYKLWNQIYHNQVYKKWLELQYSKTPQLLKFNHINMEKIVDEFRVDDKEQFNIAKNRIRELLIKEIPNEDTLEASIIRETNAKKRKGSIKKLFDRISNRLLKIKPCFLMSPTSVSMFLDPKKFQFDVVIFDEASQIRPEFAIGSIFRGKQVIVVGDRHQLPPTQYFSSNQVIDEYDETEVGDFESILDICSARLQTITLRWHYRSLHEDLITFSNASVYQNLITFPSIIEKEKDLGIENYYVENGVFEAGVNKLEAKKVAELVLEHFKTQKNRSLGVIAFGILQQDQILRELKSLRKQYPEYNSFFNEDIEERFFVKNLENVQGDERDVIILSVGYGKSKTGRISQHFGYLGQVVGYRRLNVAITRARINMKVVTSLNALDIDANDKKSRGVKMLKGYLDYANRGSEAIEKILDKIRTDEVKTLDSNFEESIFELLTNKGYLVERNVGSSGYRIDLAIKDPISNRYVLAIESDGMTYKSANTVRDRERLRSDVLTKQGWNTYRIYSTDFVRFKTDAINRLLEKVESSLKKVSQ